MAGEDKILRILLKLIADGKGADEIKSKLGEVKGEAEQTGEAFSRIGSLIGLGLGGGAVALITGVINAMKELVEEQLHFAEDNLKLTEQLNRQERQWFATAGAASTFFDVVRLGMQMNSNIHQLSDRLTELQKKLAKSGEGFDAIHDGFARFGNALNNSPLMKGTKVEQYQEEIAKAQRDLNDALVQNASAFQRGTDAANEWAQLQAGPVSAAIDKVKSNISELKVKISNLNPAASVEQNDWFMELNSHLATENRHLQQLESEQKKLNQAEDRTGRIAFHRELNTLMRQQATILQSIRAQQTLIEENPFLSADDKQTALLHLYTLEMGALRQQIQLDTLEQNKFLQGTPEWELLRQKIQGATFDLDHLGLKMIGLQQPFRTELVSWVNSFGTTAHQAAQALTGTLGTAINTTSQALTGLIFQTGNWRQSFAQAAESIVADLIRIALQFVISRTVMFVLNKAFASQESGVANSQASAAYAAWEPAAIAASTASYGAAAGFGLAAFLSAIAAGQAAGIATSAVGGGRLHEGGSVRRKRMHSGGLAHDEVPIIAQEGEIMIQRDVAQPFSNFLLALNSGDSAAGWLASMFFHYGGAIRRLHEGGREFRDTISQVPGIWDTLPGGSPWTEPTPIPNIPTSLPRDLNPISMIPPGGFGPGGGGGIKAGFDPGWQRGWAPNLLTGFGTQPGFGWAPFGPTMIPTFWVDYPGVGNVPMAVPLEGWQEPAGVMKSRHTPPTLKQHSGGLIGNRFHLGGAIGGLRSFPRLHSGGALAPALSGAGAARPGGGDVHVAAFIDQRSLGKWLSGRNGRKIVFDIFKGNKIDLGI